MDISVPEELLEIIEKLIIHSDKDEEMEYEDTRERLYIYDYIDDSPYTSDDDSDEKDENWKVEIQL